MIEGVIHHCTEMEDPDFLAAQLLPQGFEHCHLVGNTADAISPTRSKP
jgi:hypothetical protein